MKKGERGFRGVGGRSRDQTSPTVGRPADVQVSAVVWEDPRCPCDLSGGVAVRAFGARLLFFWGMGRAETQR